MSSLRISPRLFVLAAPIWACACGSGLQGVEQRLASMREEITALQNQNDRLVERVDALELRQTKAPEVGPPPARSETSERPPLKVVRLVPGEGGPGAPQGGDVAHGEAADDPSPRTVIRGRGSNVEGRLASGERMPDPEPATRRKSGSAGSDTGPTASQTKDDESPRRDSKGD